MGNPTLADILRAADAPSAAAPAAGLTVFIAGDVEVDGHVESCIVLRGSHEAVAAAMQRVCLHDEVEIVTVRPDRPTVHLLMAGQAMCGLVGTPREWPTGHRWIAWDDVDLRMSASCDGCRRALVDRCAQGRT